MDLESYTFQTLSDNEEELSYQTDSDNIAESDENDYVSFGSDEIDSDLFDSDEVDDDEPDNYECDRESNNQTLGKRTSKAPNLKPKRLQVYCNHSSRPVNKFVQIQYIGEIEPQLGNAIQNFEISQDPPQFFPPSKEWEKRTIFPTSEPPKLSTSGLPRFDLLLYAIEANMETNSQLVKTTHKNSLSNIKTPIERFYPELWEESMRQDLSNLPYMNEPFENAMSVKRIPLNKFSKIPEAIEAPTRPLHNHPPSPQHTLSEEALHLLEVEEPIVFFDTIFRKYEFMQILRETKRYRKQKHFDNAPYNFACPTYEEIRCFIGLLMWTSLVQLPNRRAYFMNSEIYELPHFRKHTTRDRFHQLLRMLHLTNNEEIPEDMSTAERFEAKLGNLLTAFNDNCKRFIIPAKSLSIDEMMVKFYGRSVVRQYIKSKPTKYGVKLWALCCGCCGYSLTQNLYLGSSAGSVSGRDVVIRLTEPYFDKGHVVYCDRFFSHLDLASYLRSRKTGMVGTSSITSLPPDLQYLVDHMHPLTWAFKWFDCEANIKHKTNGTIHHLQSNEPVSLVVWMDKKYKSKDKKVVFINNCIPNIPTIPSQFQEKNIRDAANRYSRHRIPSPPVLKAYNNRMGGVDRHDRLVGHHSIPLSAKRGYVKMIFHILDSAVVNAWILFKTARMHSGKWNLAEERRYTLSWFKENVILSLCGNFTSRKHPKVRTTGLALPTQSVHDAVKHQIRPVSQIPGMPPIADKCVKCSALKRTACAACKEPYCYDCGMIHLEEIMTRHSSSRENEDITANNSDYDDDDTIGSCPSASGTN